VRCDEQDASPIRPCSLDWTIGCPFVSVQVSWESSRSAKERRLGCARVAVGAALCETADEALEGAAALFAVFVCGCAVRLVDGDPAATQVDLLGSGAAVAPVVARSSDSVACGLSGRGFLRYGFLCAADALALAR
jgi:hypothetical protein